MQTLNEAFAAGAQHFLRGEWREGVAIYDRLAEYYPDNPQVLSNLGTGHGQLQNLGTAIALLSYAAALDPDNAQAWGNLGASFRGGLHREYKREALKKAIKADPKAIAAYGNLAGTYTQDGNPEPGIAYARKCLEKQPDNASAHSNLALLLMETGRWREAWQHWPHRWTMIGGNPRKYAAPAWNGEPVASLLVHGEQGLGDEVMFLGCLEDALRRVSGRVVLEVNARLVPLVRRSFREPQLEVISCEAEFTGEVSAQCALGDLPGLLTPEAPPKRVGYLRPDWARVMYWRAWLAERGPMPRVAIAHHGGTKQTFELVRNPPAEAWQPIIAACGSAYSIQYGPAGAARAEALGIEHVALAASDLAEQAAFIKACDLLVSVPQTALHIGGAMGHPVLGVVGNKPAWRYGLKGDMPWYGANVRLFRQAPEEDWGPVIQRVAEAVR